ncbi:MAG: hypothetical protein QXL34_07550, partial [Thermosphaera sp.]
MMVDKRDIPNGETSSCRMLFLFSLPHDAEPWWLKHIADSPIVNLLDYRIIVRKREKITNVLSRRFIALAAEVWNILWQARKTHAFIFTAECGWESLLVSLFQSLTQMRRPRHVILQFIMREKTSAWRSRLKYIFMRWLFSSVHLCVCSSRSEGLYYESVFGWSSSKWAFVPFHTDPALLNYESSGHDGFVLSAGRTFRDYETLLKAFQSITVPLRIVASPQNISLPPGEKPSHVTIDYDVPPPVLYKLMA